MKTKANFLSGVLIVCIMSFFYSCASTTSMEGAKINNPDNEVKKVSSVYVYIDSSKALNWTSSIQKTVKKYLDSKGLKSQFYTAGNLDLKNKQDIENDAEEFGSNRFLYINLSTVNSAQNYVNGMMASVSFSVFYHVELSSIRPKKVLWKGKIFMDRYGVNETNLRKLVDQALVKMNEEQLLNKI